MSSPCLNRSMMNKKKIEKRSLPIFRRRIVNVKEDVQQLFVGDRLRIEGDLGEGDDEVLMEDERLT